MMEFLLYFYCGAKCWDENFQILLIFWIKKTIWRSFLWIIKGVEKGDGWRVLRIKWPKTYPILILARCFYEYMCWPSRVWSTRAGPMGAQLRRHFLRRDSDPGQDRLRFIDELPDNITHRESLNCELWDKNQFEKWSNNIIIEKNFLHQLIIIKCTDEQTYKNKTCNFRLLRNEETCSLINPGWKIKLWSLKYFWKQESSHCGQDRGATQCFIEIILWGS